MKASIAAGGVVEHLIDDTKDVRALAGKCPPGSVAANAYGERIDAAPGQHAPSDTLRDMKKYTDCDRLEAQAELDCGAKDTTCRGDRLRELGYDFKACPGRTYLPSSGSKTGRAAVPRNMRPFEHIKCVPEKDAPSDQKAYANGTSDQNWSSRRDDDEPEANSDKQPNIGEVFPKEDRRRVLNKVLTGEMHIDALTEDERNRAATFYEQISSLVSNKYGKQAQAFNLERANYLRGLTDMPPGDLTDFMNRSSGTNDH